MHYYFLLLISLLGPQLFAQATVHRCEAGDMNYAPGHPTSAQRQTGGYDLTVLVRPEDWYDPSVLGRDAKDWLKAGGVSYYSIWRPGTWPKNRLSALVGFRMRADRRYQICAYVNDRAGKWRIEGITELPVGEPVTVKYRYSGGTATFDIITAAGARSYAFPEVEVATYQLAVGPWHGGTSAAPVGTGMVAEQKYVE